MSLAGAIRVRGSVVALYRPTYGTVSGGARKVTAWTLLATVRAQLEQLTAELAARVFGGVNQATVRAMMPADLGLAAEDGVVVTNGFLAGRRYRVQTICAYDGRARQGHQEVALQLTDEVFP